MSSCYTTTSSLQTTTPAELLRDKIAEENVEQRPFSIQGGWKSMATKTMPLNCIVPMHCCLMMTAWKTLLRMKVPGSEVKRNQYFRFCPRKDKYIQWPTFRITDHDGRLHEFPPH
jgi:hypothetical protein